MFDVIRGDGSDEMAASASARVQRYEVAEATSTTSPRQFQFELYKRRTTVLLPRDLFLDLVCDALALYKYVAPNQRADLMLACRCVRRPFVLSQSLFVLSLPYAVCSPPLCDCNLTGSFPICF